MLTPTDKAAIEGLIAAIAKHRELTQAGSPHALTEAAWNAISMRACEATEALQRLLAGETREADKPTGVPDAIKGYEQYPFAWHFGNIKVVLETMECTGKLPNGCPNCRGLSFCTKRDALKRYAKMEQCWNFWMEDPHHG